MADKDQFNDEYQFGDLDAVEPAGADDPLVAGESTTTTSVKAEKQFSPGANVKRNALIVVVLVILAMVIYKFLGVYFSERKLDAVKPAGTSPLTPLTKQEPEPKPVQVVQPIQPLQPVQPVQPVQTVNVQADPKVDQKLSALELGQQNMRSEVASVNNQLGGISSNVNALTAQITQLNQTVAALTAKVESQSTQIELLTKPKKPTIVKVNRQVVPLVKYYIQAVIPGRAWLIAPNGTTLTVREGTSIPGYGVVKLIDPNQGRILTSSGQIIRFSQEDS